MRIEQSYPTPIFGVSTLAPRNRPQGYVSKQVNFRSDPVNKLTRRPSSVYRAFIADIVDVDDLVYHSYERDGKEYSYVINTTSGDVVCLIDDVYVKTLNLGAYKGSNLGLYTIDHDTYVLNRDVVVEKEQGIDEPTLEKVSHINVTAALNYGETVQVNITFANGARYSRSYTVPDLGTSNPDYDTADKARATKQVALELARRINSGSEPDDQKIPNPDYTGNGLTCHTPYIYDLESVDPELWSRRDNPDYDPTAIECQPYLPDEPSGIFEVTAQSLGSTVAVWKDGREEWLQVEIESGQGNRTTVAINQVVESTEGLPLYAVVGTRIKVRPDPTSEKGIYYLQAERVADETNGQFLEEVVWSEDRNPDEQHTFDKTTMPHKITFEDGDFTYSDIDWSSRRTGDDLSTPFPEFLGNTIQAIGYFQKRLVFVSGNSVYMTETDDVENWFKQSAVQLLVSDPISISTSELGADKILHLVPHNRDLLCMTSNSQFKISGSEAVTPETVSMSLTTKYECQVSVPPVTIGNSIYFPIDYGDSTGLQEYTGERNTSQDFAAPVTNHIIGYLTGKAELIAASPNLEMIAMTTSDADDNKLFVYEQYSEASGKRSQQSWSEWVFAENERIIDIKFRRNELVLLVAQGDKLIVKAIPMYTRVTASPIDVYLDNMLILETDGLTATLPDNYDITDCIIVRGTGTKNELWEVQYTVDDRTVTFNEDISEGVVYVGTTFTSTFEPTRPFRYDQDGSTITTDRVRVSRWILSLVDTHEISMVKNTKYSAPTVDKFESRFVGQYVLGTIDAYTGDWKFSFAEDAALATATFFTDNYLSCTISDVSWEGQYYKSKQRM